VRSYVRLVRLRPRESARCSDASEQRAQARELFVATDGGVRRARENELLAREKKVASGRSRAGRLTAQERQIAEVGTRRAVDRRSVTRPLSQPAHRGVAYGKGVRKLRNHVAPELPGSAAGSAPSSCKTDLKTVGARLLNEPTVCVRSSRRDEVPTGS